MTEYLVQQTLLKCSLNVMPLSRCDQRNWNYIEIIRILLIF